MNESTKNETLLRTVVEDDVVKGVIGGIASTSVIIITFAAPLLGFLLYRRGMKTLYAYVFAAAVCACSVYIGFKYPVTISPNWWMVIISFYTLCAAGIPVWIVLQPRGFTNVQILYGCLLRWRARRMPGR